MTATLSLSVQSGVWPPRVLLTAGSLGNGFFTINRVVGGVRTAVRGAEDVYIYPTTDYVVVDAELPFGIPVSYEVVFMGAIEATAGPTTVTLPGGNVALTDAISGLAAEVQIGAIDDLAYDAGAAVYVTDGENRIISSPLPGAQTTVEYFCINLTARDNLLELLRNATNSIYLQRGPSPDYDADAYYGVLGARSRRFSQDGSDPRRIVAVSVAEVSGWPQGLEARGYTLQDLADAYTGLTLADVDGDFLTLLALAQAEF